MSVVTYGTVTLPYSMTNSFEQRAVYEESNTDWYLTQYDITVQTVVHADYLPIMAPDLIGTTTNPAYIMAVVRNRLLHPRQRLSYQVNGVELIPQNNLPGSVDAKNGPHPQTCTITTLTDTSFLVQYHIIAHYWELTTQALGTSTLSTTGNVGGNNNGNAVLYNRWSESVQIDNCNFTRRTRRGVYAIRSDNNVGKIADELRQQLVVVSVPTDFLRESSNYTVSPDGLTISYEVVDKEQFKMPPYPAYEASGSYTESTVSPETSFIRYAEVELSLKGPKNVKQTDLLQTALDVCTAKLQINGAPLLLPGQNNTLGQLQSKGILQSSNVTVQMYKNEVAVRLRAMKSLASVLNQVVNQPDGSSRYDGIMKYDAVAMCFTPPAKSGIIWSDANPIQYPVYGTAGGPGKSFLLQAAAYYDPALQNYPTNTQNQFGVGIEPGRAGVNPEFPST